MSDSRKIDALVAEHVMEQCLALPYEGSDELMTVKDQASAWYDYIPHYSADIAAAYEVMTKMYDYGIRIDTAGGRVDRWSVRFPEYKVRVLDESLPMAICLAVLKLKGVEYEVE